MKSSQPKLIDGSKHQKCQCLTYNFTTNEVHGMIFDCSTHEDLNLNIPTTYRKLKGFVFNIHCLWKYVMIRLDTFMKLAASNPSFCL